MAFRINGELGTCVSYSSPETLEMLKGAQQLVIERFIGDVRLNSVRLETIELVGMIRGYCYAHDIPCELATPAARYSHMRDAQRAVGSLIEASKVAKHEIDALAHLLAFEYRHAR